MLKERKQHGREKNERKKTYGYTKRIEK